MNITKLEKNDFDKLFSIMEQSFPSAEYRKKEKQYALLDDPNYNLYVFKQNGDIAAFIAYWDLGDFLFAEHLAVNKSLRNQGIGSLFMKELLSKTDSPLVLEVENVDTGIAKRRVGFYERLGFHQTDIIYNQPNFDNSDVIIPLRIMYYDSKNTLDLSKVKNTIFNRIYKKS